MASDGNQRMLLPLPLARLPGFVSVSKLVTSDITYDNLWGVHIPSRYVLTPLTI